MYIFCMLYIQNSLKMKISVIGLGCVGNAIYKSFMNKNMNVIPYDKYKDIGTLKECLTSDIMFLCLPTPYDDIKKEYDKSSIIETLSYLEENKYTGIVVLKSTVEPETTYNLSLSYPNLKIIHSPEFLTARTAYEDFHNQKHIVIGKTSNTNDEDINIIVSFFKTHYDAEISICSSTESEMMKICCNSFYSVKVQFFTEIYLMCKANKTQYNTVRDLMLKNNWIHHMHTIIPGPDNQISYGGMCFPKDTNALNQYMLKLNTPNNVLNATIEERNIMRND